LLVSIFINYEYTTVCLLRRESLAEPFENFGDISSLKLELKTDSLGLAANFVNSNPNM